MSSKLNTTELFFKKKKPRIGLIHDSYLHKKGNTEIVVLFL